ncbi:hypothetical protein CBS101457_000143 [Exobasidium rhododendri]|nr:hypothetical protein CBS101457_000143 [Exobasidium rhododendri]
MDSTHSSYGFDLQAPYSSPAQASHQGTLESIVYGAHAGSSTVPAIEADPFQGTLGSIVYGGNAAHTPNHYGFGDMTLSEAHPTPFDYSQQDVFYPLQYSPPRQQGNTLYNAFQHHLTDHGQTSTSHDSTNEEAYYPLFTPQQRKARKKMPSGRRPKSESGSSWGPYSDLMKEDIIEVLHLYSGLLKDSIAKRVRAYFTDELRDALLSGNEHQIIAARDILFDPHADNRLQQMWMIGMSMEESKKVVHKIALASGKDDERVRNYFLQCKLDPQRARAIQRASPEEAEMWVLRLGLDRTNHRRIKKGHVTQTSKAVESWPWMSHLTEKQKEEVVQRMMAASSSMSEKDCYLLLRKAGVNQGVRILHADTADIRAVIQSLRSLYQ